MGLNPMERVTLFVNRTGRDQTLVECSELDPDGSRGYFPVIVVMSTKPKTVPASRLLNHQRSSTVPWILKIRGYEDDPRSGRVSGGYLQESFIIYLDAVGESITVTREPLRLGLLADAARMRFISWLSPPPVINAPGKG